MPAETITLTQDQAEDLRELLSYAEILKDWLLHAPSDILNELARFAYHGHFHPYSAAWWLIEDLGHLRCRLRKTLPAISTSETGQRLPSVNVIAETETRPTASSRDDLDTAISIGNQIIRFCLSRRITALDFAGGSASGPLGVQSAGMLRLCWWVLFTPGRGWLATRRACPPASSRGQLRASRR